MKQEQIKDSEYDVYFPEKAKKRKKGKGRFVLFFFGILAVLILAGCGMYMLTMWLGEQAAFSGREDFVNTTAGAVTESGMVTMTQEQLDALLEKTEQSARSEVQAQAQAEKEQAAASARKEVLNGIRAGLETGDDTVVEVLRPFYPDDIVVVSGGKYHFVPVNRELKLNSYTDENLNILESGEFQYVENEAVVSHKGIDVSRFQGKIDWKKVAADGVEFAFVRAANRGYGTGKLVEDTTFDTNISGALSAGIHVGAYIYTQAVNEAEMLEEAELLLKKLAPYHISCPIIIDVEKTSDAGGRMNKLTPKERTDLVLLFCRTVENAGYKPIIYHNMEMGALMLEVETLEAYDKWFAYYNDDMYYPYEYKIWQYSDKGKVDGITTNVDMNISFSAFWEE